MSDMYLVLRRRLETVRKRWVEVPTGELRSARLARGLSYESIARQLPVSSKTWERYEKDGHIPIELVDRVAEILALEIERPEFVPTTIKVPADGLTGADLSAVVERQGVLLLRIAEHLGVPADAFDDEGEEDEIPAVPPRP